MVEITIINVIISGSLNGNPNDNQNIDICFFGMSMVENK